MKGIKKGRINYEQRKKADRDFNEYPDGTKFHAITGGYWVKEGSGKFRWCSSHCTFPRPGGDWDGTITEP